MRTGVAGEGLRWIGSKEGAEKVCKMHTFPGAAGALPED